MFANRQVVRDVKNNTSYSVVGTPDMHYKMRNGVKVPIYVFAKHDIKIKILVIVEEETVINDPINWKRQ